MWKGRGDPQHSYADRNADPGADADARQPGADDNRHELRPTFGISGLTQFSFNASASDPDGDPVTYTWDVAGSAFTGSSGAATFTGSATPGTARLTVSDGRGLSAGDSRTFTVGSMSGAWTVTTDDLAGATLTMRVKLGAFTDFNMNGRMDDSGRRVTGNLQGSGFNGQPFTMTK